MSRALVIINGPADREKVARWAHGVPVGTRIEFKETKRSVPQNDRFWALLTDIAAEMKKRGRDHDVSQWKTIFMAAFGLEVKFLPSLDQKTFIPLGHSSSDLSVKEMSDLMEWMAAWAAENNVPLRDNTNTDDAASLPASEEVGADVSPASASASSSLSRTDRTDLMECAKKLFGITADEELTPEARRGVLVTAKDEWKAYLPEELHDRLRTIFMSADAVIKGNSERDAVLDEIAYWLECEPKEIGA